MTDFYYDSASGSALDMEVSSSAYSLKMVYVSGCNLLACETKEWFFCLKSTKNFMTKLREKSQKYPKQPKIQGIFFLSNPP